MKTEIERYVEDVTKLDHKEVTWHDFAKVFDPDITEEETKYILMEHTAYPMGGFLHNAKLMREYFESK
jgi:hypothetical protein